jgi:DNA-binding PadR family transcriptional regulator
MNAKSNLEFALIGLLKQKPQSGYDLRKTFITTAMRHYSDSPGSIYPALRRLEARGWIAAEAESPHEAADPRKRRAYRLTPAGEASLVRWLEMPVTRNDVIFEGSELMLRFAYMDGNVPRSSALRFLDQFERELSLYIGELRAQLEQMSSKLPAHTGVLAFQSGIEQMEAQIAWAQKARALLGKESS